MKPFKYKFTQTIIYMVLLVVIVIMMGLTRKCNRGDILPLAIQGNSPGDTVDVAVIYNPLGYYLYGDTLGGINYDFLKLFSKHSGLPVKMWPVVTLETALKDLEKGTYDMLASLPSDNSVKQRFLVSRSIFLDKMTLVQRIDSAGEGRIKSALDLSEDTVHIQAASPARARLTNLSNEIGAQINVVEDKDLSEEYLCMKVASGEISCAIVNEKTARAMKKRYPLLNYDNPVSFTQFQVWLINMADTALLHAVDTWLDEFRDTPDYSEIMSRYTSNQIAP